MEKGQVLEFTIEDMSGEGKGIGKADGFAFDIFDETGDNRIGFILQTLNIPSSGYGISICLTYTDMDNLEKSEKILSEDL